MRPFANLFASVLVTKTARFAIGEACKDGGTHLILERPQVAGPGVSVPVILPLLAEVAGHVAVDDGLHQCDALYTTQSTRFQQLCIWVVPKPREDVVSFPNPGKT